MPITEQPRIEFAAQSKVGNYYNRETVNVNSELPLLLKGGLN